MYGALTSMDKALMLRLFRNGVLLSVVQAFSEETMQLLRHVLGSQMGARFERHLIHRIARDGAFYHLGQVDSRGKDFWHRIPHDGGILVRVRLGNLIVSAISPLLRVTHFTVRVGQILGYKWIFGMS